MTDKDYPYSINTMKTILLFLFICLSTGMVSSQILTFEFAGLAGNEATANSNFNDANIGGSVISRGAGLTASNNANRFNATNWALTSIANAVTGNDYMEFTITPNGGCDFSISSIFVQLQRSSTGPSALALRSSVDGFAANLDTEYAIVDNTSTQTFTFTFTQTAITAATTYRIYMYAEETGGSGGIGDGPGNDLIVYGSTNCGVPATTITTGTVNGGPFEVDCNGTTDAGTVDFTSTGTFNAGNTYTAFLSDATGDFSSPINIGSITSTANSGSIPFTLPASLPTGSGYQIQIVASNPGTIGTNSASFTITQLANCGPVLPASEGLIINEWSNGASGNQEYYEFVVAGQCGTLVDIRGYILDDNNGTFTTPANYSGTASGIAPGHFRFANDPQWANIPVGSLILIYNAADPNPSLPPDDPTDADNDSLYVIPHTHPLFESCTTMPGSGSPDSTYTPCTYSSGGAWGPLSLRNSGDAIQVRSPNGAYYHGISYGGAEMSGGPHGLKLFTGSGTNMCGWFSSGDFFDVANWSSGTTGGNETPGLPNNASNYAWLVAMRDISGVDCPITVLPVELSLFDGNKTDNGNLLYWRTDSEYNSKSFTLERSSDGKNWEEINTQSAAYNSNYTINYSFLDTRFQTKVNYYRLHQTDIDGTNKLYKKIVVIDNDIQKGKTLVGIYNLLGQSIDENAKGVQIHHYSDGSSEKIVRF